MSTKAKSTVFNLQPEPEGGALAPSRGQTPAPLATTGGKPKVQSLADLGSIYFSAKRFIDRPEIADTFFWGTNGISCRMPQTDHARLSLYHRLPQPEACMRLEALLASEIAKRATPSGIRQAVTAAIASFPSGARADAAYIASLVDLLVEEASLAGWHHLAVIGGLIRIARTSTFLPSASEVIEAIHTERETIWSARVFAQKAQEVFQELEGRLIWAGLITIELDGDDWGDLQ